MGIAIKLADYLRTHPVQYNLVRHAPTGNSLESAAATHLSPGCVVKAVVLEDDDKRFLVAVLPASRKVDLEMLRSRTGRALRLASEAEVGERFADCRLGAVPPIGQAYGIETVWDESLAAAPEVYFEAGDHETLVHVNNADFMRLLEGAPHMPLSEPMGQRARPLF
jgi:Ala-tRNA(Pro) deacylase